MSEKIKDGITGGTYPDGNYEPFIPSDGRLGLTGKFNQLVDEVGQITTLNTNNKNNIVGAINETNTSAVASVKLDSTPQTLVGSYTFGNATGTENSVNFKHDVEFEGNVRFSGGSGNTLNLDNNFISLGNDQSASPVGDGGVILERGLNLQNAEFMWDESDSKWKLKSATSTYSPIVHEDMVNSNALTYIKTGELNSPDLEITSNTPNIKLTRSNATTNNKTWNINNSLTDGDLVVSAISDSGATTSVAYEINRSATTITGHQFFTSNTERLNISNTNVTANVPIKVDTIVESTNDNGINVDGLKVRDTSILSGSNIMVNYTNVASVINPNSTDLDFTVNGNGSQAFNVDAGTSQIFSRYNTYFDQTLFVDTISQRNSNGITFNHIVNCPSNINISNTQPIITLTETDQTTNQKTWNVRSSGSTFFVSSINDANSSTKPAYSITRTSNNPATHNMYVGDNVMLGLSNNSLNVGEDVTDGDKQINLNVKDGFKCSLFFRQNNALRAGLEYSDLTDRINLIKYANIGGAYVGGILVGETEVFIDNLPLTVESDLNANTINPRTGTTTTLTNNVNITGTFATNGDRIVFGTISDQVDRIEFNETTNEFNFIEDGSINNSIISGGRVKINNTAAAVNTRSTISSVNSSGEYVLASVSDDGLTTSNIHKNVKSGINTTQQQFYINDNIELTITNNTNTFGSGLVDSNTKTINNAKSGFDSSFQINQGSVVKGAVQYTDSTNKLDINRYADVGGAYVGGISISETNVLVDNLSLDVETTLKVDTINEYTNNAGITVDGVLIKDNSVTTISDVKTNTINERTANSGVNIDGVLLKDNQVFLGADDSISFNDSTNTYIFSADGSVNNATIDTNTISTNQVTLKGSYAVSSPENINVIIDNDNNQTGNTFNVYSHLNSPSNTLLSLNDSGNLNVYTRNEGSNLNIIDLGSSDTLATPQLNLFRNSTVGGTTTHMGLIGHASTLNEDMYIANYTNGHLVLTSNANIDLRIDADNNSSSTFNVIGVNGTALTVDEAGNVNTNNVTAGNLTATIGVNTNTINVSGTATTNNLDVNGAIISTGGQVASTWCTFNGQGTPAILDSYNVSNVVRLGTGSYRIDFLNPLPNTNYGFSLSSLNNGALNQYFVAHVMATAVATNSIAIRVLGDNGGAWNPIDLDRVSVIIFAKQ